MPSPRAYMKSRWKRRLKTEIERNYRCVVPGCPKAYGSENSLNQHLKLKHLDFWNKIKNSPINYNDYLYQVW